MTRKTKITSFLAITLLGLATVLSAADEKAQMKEEREATAQIVSVDRSAMTVTVRIMDREINEPTAREEYTTETAKEGETLRLKLTKNTHIWEDGRDPMTVGELQAGQRVNVRYYRRGGEVEASDVKVDKKGTQEKSEY